MVMEVLLLQDTHGLLDYDFLSSSILAVGVSLLFCSFSQLAASDLWTASSPPTLDSNAEKMFMDCFFSSNCCRDACMWTVSPSSNIIMMFVQTLVKFLTKKFEKTILSSLHHVAPILWAPDSVGARVTQWRGIQSHLMCCTDFLSWQ